MARSLRGFSRFWNSLFKKSRTTKPSKRQNFRPSAEPLEDRTVPSVNHAPLGADHTVSTLQDMPYAFQTGDFGFTDPDDTPANNFLGVKITAYQPGGGATLTNNGVAIGSGAFVSISDISGHNLVYAPSPDAIGADYYTFQVQDDGGTDDDGIDTDSTPRTMTIAITWVNHAPAGANNTLTTLEDSPVVVLEADFGFADSAIDSANNSPNSFLAVKFVTLADGVSLTNNGAPVSAGDVVSISDIAAGQVLFTPPLDANGSALPAFTFQVQDNGGTANGGHDLSATATMTVDVTPVNDAPTFTGGSDQTVNEDAAAQSITGWAVFHPGGGSDEAGQSPIGYTVGNFSNPSLFSVLPAVSLNGTLTYTLAANANGSSTFDVTVQDDGGTANYGQDTSVAQTYSITVNAVNDAPSFTASNPPAVNEDDAPVSIPGWATFNPGGGAAEAAQGAIYTVSAISNPALFAVAPAVDANGKLTYTLAANANGSSTFNVTVKDDGGTDNDGQDTSATETFTAFVQPEPVGGGALSGPPVVPGNSNYSFWIDTPAGADVGSGQVQLLVAPGGAAIAASVAAVTWVGSWNGGAQGVGFKVNFFNTSATVFLSYTIDIGGVRSLPYTLSVDIVRVTVGTPANAFQDLGGGTVLQAPIPIVVNSTSPDFQYAANVTLTAPNPSDLASIEVGFVQLVTHTKFSAQYVSSSGDTFADTYYVDGDGSKLEGATLLDTFVDGRDPWVISAEATPGAFANTAAAQNGQLQTLQWHDKPQTNVWRTFLGWRPGDWLPTKYGLLALNVIDNFQLDVAATIVGADPTKDPYWSEARVAWATNTSFTYAASGFSGTITQDNNFGLTLPNAWTISSAPQQVQTNIAIEGSALDNGKWKVQFV